jgi:hypothetical protein
MRNLAQFRDSGVAADFRFRKKLSNCVNSSTQLAYISVIRNAEAHAMLKCTELTNRARRQAFPQFLQEQQIKGLVIVTAS